MKYREEDGGYLIRLEWGEELVATLTGFCAEHDIKAGWITGIGGVQRATVGYFNPKRKKYILRRIKEAAELLSLTGDVSEVDGKPFLHLHATISNHSNKVRGGHVDNIIIGATAEIRLKPFKEQLTRSLDENIGLKLLDL